MTADQDRPIESRDRNPYASPQESSWMKASESERHPSESRFSRALFFAIVQQLVVVIIGSQILDGGDIFKCCIVAALLSWAPILVIGWRIRRAVVAISKTQIVVVKYNFWLFFVIMFVIYSSHLLPYDFYFSHRVKSNRPPITAQP
jgi:hypothetical protein